MSNDGTLPQDIITNILSRLPVKSLLRFKCVSPLWKSLISDPHFARTHLNQTKNSKYPEQKIIISTRFGNLYSVDCNDVNPTTRKLEFPTVEQHDAEKWVQVLCSCDGLLLVSRSDNSIFLLNPSTRECKKLPICPFVQIMDRYHSPDVYGVGYDSSTDDYKVLMFSYIYEYGSNATVVTIYSLKTNAWRRIEDLHNRSTVGHFGGVFLNGCLHYLCRTGNGSTRITAFDLSGEIFKEVPLGRCSEYDRVVVLGGSLSLVDGQGSKVCMMKEYGARESWTKFTMCPGWYKFDVVCMLAEDEFVLFDADGERHLTVYNPQKFTEMDIEICDIPTKFNYGGTYIESLISPSHVGGIGRQL